MNDDLDVVAFAEQRYADWPNGIRANMVMSLDGAAVFRGRVGPLSSSADQRLFHALRAMADVILVGVGTARVEGYGPAVLDDDLGALRIRQLGASATPAPRMAVVTRSCSVPAKSLGHLPGVRPIVITTSAADPSPVTELADVIVAGDVEIDFARVVDELRSRGLRRILCEGGPTLLSALTEAGLVDELCLTLAPMLTAEPGSVGSDSVVPSTNPLRAPLRTTLRHSVTHDDYIFLRYAQRPAP